MQNQKLQTALLQLLRTGLWGEQKGLTEFPLSPEDWQDVYRLAQEHTVEGLVFDGLQSLPVEFMPPRELLLKWTVRIDQIERIHMRMNHVIGEQLHLFRQEKLNPLLLKGQGVAACYRTPNHRVCGDIDWYFNSKEYPSANELLKRSGIKVNYTAGFSSEYLWKGVVSENHSRFFDLHNPFCNSYLKKLKSRNPGIQINIAGNDVLVPEPLTMCLQVNSHILKHLLSFGIGLRQLCDSARIYHACRKGLNGVQLRKVYERLGILKWVDLLHVILVKYMGLPQSSLPFELPSNIEADWMMEEIWKSGNFGFFDIRYPEERQPGAKRNHSSIRVWSNVRKYFRYAPGEALSFPLVHFYSKSMLK